MPDASTAVMSPKLHLLLTEVALAPNDYEFVELYNPTDEAVDLSTYYLADNQQYARLPGAFGAGPGPGITDQHDFVVKFPDGALIAPGAVMVVAMRYIDFSRAYRMPPDFALAQTTGDTAMISARPNLTGEDPQLSNDGEGVVLFTWDGMRDLVSDVDMVTAGQALEEFNRLPNKTLLNVDGPDADNNVSTYRPEAYRIGVMEASAGPMQSHKRIAMEDGHESRDRGGNGLYGDDESTEDIRMTWDMGLSEPTPGEVAKELVQATSNAQAE